MINNSTITRRKVLGALSAGVAGSVLTMQSHAIAAESVIKLGTIAPLSGPNAAYGELAKTAAALAEKVNSEGGLNGRKINLIVADDGYNPAKAMEQVKKLVERDKVLAIVMPVGTPTNTAIRKYLNDKKVPQYFLSSGASKWDDIKNYPWTLGWNATYSSEGVVYVDYALKENPDAKIAVLAQNDDYGQDMLNGVKSRLKELGKSERLVKTETYEITDPAIENQLITLKNSQADVLILPVSPKFATLAIKRAYELDWHPKIYLSTVTNSINGVLKPAGSDVAKGVRTGAYIRDVYDPKYKGREDTKEFLEVMKKYYPQGDPGDVLTVFGYSMFKTVLAGISNAGDDLTAEGIMKSGRNLDMPLPMGYDGIRVHTDAKQLRPISDFRLLEFDGEEYQLLE